MREFPDVMLIVDTVSSFSSAVPIPMDELGIDVLLTGSQKALAMPPGLALFSACENAPSPGPRRSRAAATTSISSSSKRTRRRT